MFTKKDRDTIKFLEGEIQRLWNKMEGEESIAREGYKRLTNVEKKVVELADKVTTNNETLRLQVERDFEQFKTKITDKYMQSIERLFDFMKQMAVVVVASGSNKDVAALKREFMMPYLEEKAEATRHAKGAEIDKKIKTLGRKLLDKRQEIEDRKIKKGRRHPTPEDDTAERAQLEIIDFIIKGEKNA
jgi:hypothetical protein